MAMATPPPPPRQDKPKGPSAVAPPGISGGPYEPIIPFVNIEDIAVAGTPETNVITLRISNEISSIIESKKVVFSNFVFFSPDKSVIESMNVNDTVLKQNILRYATEVRNFSLDAEKDFKLKAYITPTVRILNNTYKIIKNFSTEMTQLYVLVASFMEYAGKVMIGNVIKETILLSNRTQLDASMYSVVRSQAGYGLKNSIWPAAVHLTLPQKTPMAGRKHIEDPHPPLEEDRIINVKTKDYRVLNEAGKIILNPQTTVVVKAPGQQYGQKVPEKAIFSELHLSRAATGTIFGYFGFDIFTYFQKNSLFGAYIKNPAALASCLELVDIKVFRSTTKKLDITGNKLTPGSAGSGMCKIMQPSNETLFNEVASLGNGAKIIKKFSNNNILGIAFRDDDAKQYAMTGIRYKVEIVLSDHTKDLLEFLSANLSLLISNCQQGKAQIGELINLYMASIEFIFGASAFGEFTQTEWQKNLMTFTSIFTLEPQPRQFILNALINNYTVALEALANSNVKGSKSDVPAWDSAIYMSQGTTGNLLLEKHMFSRGFAVSNNTGIGLNYIDDFLSDAHEVIPSMTYQTMTDRINAELEKYPEANANAEEVNIFGYMSPTAINVGVGQVQTPNLEVPTGDTGPAPFSGNYQTNTPVTDPTPHSIGVGNAMVMNHVGVQVASLNVNLNRLVAAEALVEPSPAPASEYISNIAFANSDNTQVTSQGGNDESIVNVNQPSQTMHNSYNNTFANSFINSELGDFNNPSPPSPTNAPGSLAVASPVASQTPVDTLSAIINFGSLVRVEHLSSYGATLGVGLENWLILDQPIFEAAVANNELLICRLAVIDEDKSTPANEVFKPLSTLFSIGPIGDFTVVATWRTFLQSLIDAYIPYQLRFESLVNRLQRYEPTYSKVIPYDLNILGAAAFDPPVTPSEEADTYTNQSTTSGGMIIVSTSIPFPTGITVFGKINLG